MSTFRPFCAAAVAHLTLQIDKQKKTGEKVVKGALGSVRTPEDCANLHGRVVMEHPDKLINNFKGKLVLETARRASAAASATVRQSNGVGGGASEGAAASTATDGGGKASSTRGVEVMATETRARVRYR